MATELISGLGSLQEPRSVVVDNVLSRYYSEVAGLLARTGSSAPTSGFTPGFDLPSMSTRIDAFFAASDVAWLEAGSYGGHRLSLLDLRRNPTTQTTKTLASLLIVARAVHHIRRTGERVMIVTPSSANKATALRDAVLRAVDNELVEPDELSITCVVPTPALPKLRESALSRDPGLRARNPVLVLSPNDPGVTVKSLVQRFAAETSDSLGRSIGTRLWFTLALDNYRVADAVRAFVEQDSAPAATGPRVHVHAVSSAFGLLGHAYGLSWRGRAWPSPQYLLVQQLDAPDMVLDLYRDSFDRDGLPSYRLDDTTGLYTQDADPHFPMVTYDPQEVLDSTFYTHAPPTAPEMKSVIRRQGGGGIVVSLYECLNRYPTLRMSLARLGIRLPQDPRNVREWSLPMALTGALNAADRGLLPPSADMVVHASGVYGVDDYQPLRPEAAAGINDENDLAAHVAAAAGVRS